MAKKQPLPIKKKRFNAKVIKVICGDCQAVMDRWMNPNDETEEHFETKCPVCGMHIKHYINTFYCIDENGRSYLEVRWNKDLDWKKEFLQKEHNYYENKKAQKEEYDRIYEAFEKSDKDENVPSDNDEEIEKNGSE